VVARTIDVAASPQAGQLHPREHLRPIALVPTTLVVRSQVRVPFGLSNLAV
jgi:hypothetical protein